jgi:Periplasmic sensor domain found in signal transduction proteins
LFWKLAAAKGVALVAASVRECLFPYILAIMLICRRLPIQIQPHLGAYLVIVSYLQRIGRFYSANRLAWHLIMAVFATGLVVTVAMTLFLLKQEYERSLLQTKADLQTLGQSAAPQLASNLWLVNSEAIRGQLDSMLQTRVVQHVSLLESDGQHYSAGVPLEHANNVVTEVFPVVYLHPLTNKHVVLGELKISTTLSEVKSRLYAQFFRLLFFS